MIKFIDGIHDGFQLRAFLAQGLGFFGAIPYFRIF